MKHVFSYFFSFINQHKHIFERAKTHRKSQQILIQKLSKLISITSAFITISLVPDYRKICDRKICGDRKGFFTINSFQYERSAEKILFQYFLPRRIQSIAVSPSHARGQELSTRKSSDSDIGKLVHVS